MKDWFLIAVLALSTYTLGHVTAKNTGYTYSHGVLKGLRIAAEMRMARDDELVDAIKKLRQEQEQ